MNKRVYEQILSRKQLGQKQLAVLVDPDKEDGNGKTIGICKDYKVDLLFVGGSLISSGNIEQTVSNIKETCDIPVILFPGSEMQITPAADAILYLSLISGRNPELLIGKQVVAAPYLKQSGLEILSTGYMLVDGGSVTTVQYMSNTMPIPSNKPDIAAATALAGEYLGLKLLYLDAGSGAINPIPSEMLRRVREQVNIPMIVGGGIKTAEQAYQAWVSGADVVVIGNAIEKDYKIIEELVAAAQEAQ